MEKISLGRLTKIGLSRRAAVALAVSAASLFLLLCLTTYGREEAEIVRRSADAGIAPTIAGWFVTVCGAGSYVVAILGLAWGVIVYFQERTPDLVLRGVGTALLAVSTAMIAGLVGQWNGDPGSSLWAGTVGTAAARALTGWGTAGSVFGGLVAAALFAVSLIFATDWLFHTVRRGDAASGGAPAIPTEPSRGDLLDDPAEAEPRQYVRTGSRAAEAAAALATQPPVVATPRFTADEMSAETDDEMAVETTDEIADEPLPAAAAPEPTPEDFVRAVGKLPPIEPPSEFPAGWSRSRLGDRDLVRAPQGYAGVEFLSTADDLADPEPARGTSALADTELVTSQSDAGFLDDFDFEPDAVFVTEPEPGREPPAPASAPAPAAAKPAAPVREVAAEDKFPTGGIGFADPALYLDDEILDLSVAPFRDEPELPHDGGSAAGEIASAYAPRTPPPAAAAAPATPLPAAAADAAPAPAAEVESLAAEDSPVFEDEILVGSSFFADDEVFLVETPAAPVEEPPAAVASAASAEALPPAAPDFEVPDFGRAAAFESAVAPVAERPSIESPAAREPAAAVEPWDFPRVDGRVEDRDDAEDEPAPSLEAPQSEASSIDAPPVAEMPTLAPLTDEASAVAPAAPVEEPVAAAPEATSVPAPAVEPSFLADAPPAVPQFDPVPAETPSSAIAEAPTPEASAPQAPIETAVESVEPPPAEQQSAEPAPAATATTESPETVAPAPVVPAAAAAPAPQLALFPPPACDLSKLVTLELDPLFHAASEAILLRGRASAVVLQRTLGIGYARALRILDQMTAAGMLGPDTPGGSREICFTREQWDRFRA